MCESSRERPPRCDARFRADYPAARELCTLDQGSFDTNGARAEAAAYNRPRCIGGIDPRPHRATFDRFPGARRSGSLLVERTHMVCGFGEGTDSAAGTSWKHRAASTTRRRPGGARAGSCLDRRLLNRVQSRSDTQVRRSRSRRRKTGAHGEGPLSGRGMPHARGPARLRQ